MPAGPLMLPARQLALPSLMQGGLMACQIAPLSHQPLMQCWDQRPCPAVQSGPHLVKERKGLFELGDLLVGELCCLSHAAIAL